jgi:hypothetical protein
MSTGGVGERMTLETEGRDRVAWTVLKPDFRVYESAD